MTIGGAEGKWCLTQVKDVRVDLPATSAEVLLQEVSPAARQLVIPIGLSDASAMAFALRGIKPPRPLSHDVFCEVLRLSGVIVEAVRISGKQGSLYVAELESVGSKGRHVVDCRPSDALGILLRQRVPVPLLVSTDLFGVSAPLTGS